MAKSRNKTGGGGRERRSSAREKSGAGSVNANELPPTPIHRTVREALARDREQQLVEGMEHVNRNCDQPLSRIASQIRAGLKRFGTNVEKNDGDLLGDGDQSLIKGRRQRQFHRELFSTGGDIHNCIYPVNTLRLFSNAVLQGDVQMVETMLKKADTRVDVPSQELLTILESRETSMRLTPLLLIVSLGKNVDNPSPVQNERFQSSLINIAKLLLQYGARPDAKDVVGKTVFHYGAGAFATDMTLKVADMCLKAQEGSSYMFGKRVELTGLKNVDMNGQQGIARGFCVDSMRRSVSLLAGEGSSGQRVVAVKPDNLRVLGENPQQPSVRLCDIQDRLGGVCLQEVIMQERADVATWLLERNVRVDIRDCDGTSPLSMAMSPQAQMGSRVCQLIKEHSTKSERCSRLKAKRACTNCRKEESANVSLSVCAACKETRYCSRDCQIQHWRASHEIECRAIQVRKRVRVVLQPPNCNADLETVTINHVSGRLSDKGGYHMPSGVKVGEKFSIKVQANGTRKAGSLLVYDESRYCNFYMFPDQHGYVELHDVVKAERATNGTKTYMKAMFDEEGNCVAFPGETRIYTW